MNYSQTKTASESGFSLLELIIGMSIALVIMSIASILLASSFSIRSRENLRTAAVADAQRALNSLSRDIGNAGYGLSTNGIVAGDSGPAQIRVRSDLNLSGATDSSDEDVKYQLINDANGSFIVRMNLKPAQTTSLLANRIDGMAIYYYDQQVTYTVGNGVITNVQNASGLAQAQVSPDLAKYIVILLKVTLPAVGTPRSPGYQPQSQTQLVSTVALRNSRLQYY